MEAFSNFAYKGEVPYNRLPDVLTGYNFGLLPYRNIDSINFSSPLKIWQYLSLGMPVLSYAYDNLPVLPGFIHDFTYGVSRQACVYPNNFDAVLKGKSWVEAAQKIIDFSQGLEPVKQIDKHPGRTPQEVM